MRTHTNWLCLLVALSSTTCSIAFAANHHRSFLKSRQYIPNGGALTADLARRENESSTSNLFASSPMDQVSDVSAG